METQVENSSFAAVQAESLSTPAKNHHHPSSISKVRVVLRIRPFLPQEISSINGSPISCVSLQESEPSSDEVTVLLKDQDTSRNECYKLDAFFGQEDSNVSEIFEREVRPLIPGVFEGYNATVFAYGATGSGKTYTMQGSDKLPGLMPLALSSILSMCKSTGSIVAISYYEIYLDKCYDLLEPKEKEIMVWNDKDGQMHLKGLAQIDVDSMAKFHEVFSSALQRRKVAHTGLNDVSSRSHAVLVITISTPSHDVVNNAVTGKLNLIDLAGNEDNRRTCNEGIRLQESAKINQSLFALSNVIYALNNKKPRIPYRESKLTRILQDSLGGTSRALMVACLNPGEYQESVHTVSLAARSRHVSNFVCSAQRNVNSNMKVDMEAKLLAWLESKGKTKSSQRMGLFHSPFPGRTPSSMKSMRKLNTCTHSNDTKAVRDQLSDARRSPCIAGKNLFHGGVHADKSHEVSAKLGELFADYGLIPMKCFRMCEINWDMAQTLAAAETNKERSVAPPSSNASESNSAIPDELLSWEEEARISKCVNAGTVSPVHKEIKELRSPQRKVLSPIDVNTGKTHFIPSDPKTPKLHTVQDGRENNFQELGTPLDKFTARSSNLKSSLVQEYLEFLNTASREELLELKGIGQKIAEYIIELRETSPLKSLGDLEKTGLSSKQVHNMFGRAARGVLEKFIHNP
ncbi:UNVERIFIED_CONTAM: Kinesin-like protein KIN-10B [Sesamum radiatum]|uniref:Kinesin-like protein n=1 Tax=Sesamum radiatum TaxID=300843 RepID=A0AAW2KS95_SESRA